jgi:Holliday junction DNA helicase RuvA
VIGSVRGTVLERSATGEVLVEVGGVGYRCLVPLGATAALEPGGAAFLFTHLYVREDAMVLYGFASREERDTFEVLIAASGVGPKLALAILSVHSPGALRPCAWYRASGNGRRSASSSISERGSARSTSTSPTTARHRECGPRSARR